MGVIKLWKFTVLQSICWCMFVRRLDNLKQTILLLVYLITIAHNYLNERTSRTEISHVTEVMVSPVSVWQRLTGYFFIVYMAKHHDSISFHCSWGSNGVSNVTVITIIFLMLLDD